ncbi:DJ-1/PfpI family protein [Mesorhizobium shangrilense]|uniref:DJ-1/PfpI family protein n=1 Tax=Mesorhizobium shangrilense TaxID=460060 RepID=A0ABV2DIH6_9HYPH
MSDQEKNNAGERPLQVGMLLFPGFTLQDLAGPQTAFGLHAKTHLIWKTLDPVPTDMGVTMNPTITIDDVPDNLDILFVPGGGGTPEIMKDQEILDFLARSGSTARYVTAVCTGSVIIGMAGLLDGYRAATYWPFYEPLKALGIEPSYERVCIDRNRITGGGVTAGIDFALTILAEIKGQEAAEFTQLVLEYDPQPPFNSGHPRSARPELVEKISGLWGRTAEAVRVAQAHMQRLKKAEGGATA